jgi:hypothetical protein
MTVSFPEQNGRLTELRRELLGNRPGKRVGDDIHVPSHRFRGLRFLRVLPARDLLVLLEVMTAVSDEQSIQRVERQIGVGATQEFGNLRRVASQALDRCVLLGWLPAAVASGCRLTAP